MLKHFLKEFNDDVGPVARSKQFIHDEVAHDFQISVPSLKRWFDQANIDDGPRDGLTSAEQDKVGRHWVFQSG